MNTIILDLRHSIRTLRKSSTFTIAAVLSLAIGIGAVAADFGIADTLLLRPLPYRDPDRLVILRNRSPGLGITQDWFSTAQYFDIKNNHRPFEQVATAIGGNYNLTGKGEPERVGTIRVSSNLLTMLGTQAEIGRLFVVDEDQPGRTATAVVSYGMWTRRYGGKPDILRQTITLNGSPCEVVGVLPRSFSLPREVMPTVDGAEQAEVLLQPNERLDGTFRLDTSLFGGLAAGEYRIEARLSGWREQDFTATEWSELTKMGGGLLRGEVPASTHVTLNP